MRAELSVLTGSGASAGKIYIILCPKNQESINYSQSYSIKSEAFLFGTKFSKIPVKHKGFAKGCIASLMFTFVNPLCSPYIFENDVPNKNDSDFYVVNLRILYRFLIFLT